MARTADNRCPSLDLLGLIFAIITMASSAALPQQEHTALLRVEANEAKIEAKRSAGGGGWPRRRRWSGWWIKPEVSTVTSPFSSPYQYGLAPALPNAEYGRVCQVGSAVLVDYYECRALKDYYSAEGGFRLAGWHDGFSYDWFSQAHDDRPFGCALKQTNDGDWHIYYNPTDTNDKGLSTSVYPICKVPYVIHSIEGYRCPHGHTVIRTAAECSTAQHMLALEWGHLVNQGDEDQRIPGCFVNNRGKLVIGGRVQLPRSELGLAASNGGRVEGSKVYFNAGGFFNDGSAKTGQLGYAICKTGWVPQ